MLVEFPNLSEQAKPAQLLGYLARPDQGLSAYLGGHAHGAGPYPAVVVLHGCSGLSSHSTETADQIAAWGYAVLAVDSLGPRGIASRCGAPTLPDQAVDAYEALRYLLRLILSTRSEWQSLANLWVVLLCLISWIATWPRSIPIIGSARQSPITQSVGSPRQ